MFAHRPGLFAAAVAIVASCGATLAPAAAAYLKPRSEIRGSVVHLSDLFSGLDPGQDCALGSGPGPGEHLVLQDAQLHAIADEFGVAWEARAGQQATVIYRRGRLLTKAELAQEVRTALLPIGLPVASVVDLVGFSPIMVGSDSRTSVTAGALDQAGKHFSATLLITGSGEDDRDVPLAGTIDTLARVVVTSRQIMAGETLREADLVVAQVSTGVIRGDVLASPEAGIGLLAPHGLAKGIPVLASELRRPDLIRRGSIIQMRLSSDAIQVVAQGRAIDSGSLGDRVRMVNLTSKAILIGTVVAADAADVDPDSVPIAGQGTAGDAARGPYGGGQGALLRAGANYDYGDRS